MAVFRMRFLVLKMLMASVSFCLPSCGYFAENKGVSGISENLNNSGREEISWEFKPSCSLLISPETPRQGSPFSIIAAGGKDLKKAEFILTGPSGEVRCLSKKEGDGIPCWKWEIFLADLPGTYLVSVRSGQKELITREFRIVTHTKPGTTGNIRDKEKGWSPESEVLYSAWINALFDGCSEDDSWKSLHEVTQNKANNFLFNHLSLSEDEREGKIRVIMQPDCADNPFFLRAYFAWKMGLPCGYHLCDRGSLGKNPAEGVWVKNESLSQYDQSVPAFNSFLRKVMNGVHSGTARTSFDNDRSDYYPVALTRQSLLPGIVFADPYGHTLVIVSWIKQTAKNPGILLAVDAQPDGTVGIKRFWKGNFLFTTSEVIGEPGFKAFRPIKTEKGVPILLKNKELTASSGFIPFSLQQRKMESEVFYHTMERLINPSPLDPEAALTDLINALREQLLVRVISVANGEDYMRSHPGTVIPMPSTAAGLFQAGGQWENFSTPNRDLRLLIAMDAVLGFPGKVAQSPGEFGISVRTPPEKVKKELQDLLDQMVSDRFITYTRTDGSSQRLTLGEILGRKEAFEMAYNPNDGIEIRWGAPEKSEERATCKRYAPPFQHEKMLSLRKWFQNRLHPPT